MSCLFSRVILPVYYNLSPICMPVLHSYHLKFLLLSPTGHVTTRMDDMFLVDTFFLTCFMTLQTMVDYASIIICGKKVAFEHGKVHWKVEYYALLYCCCWFF